MRMAGLLSEDNAFGSHMSGSPVKTGLHLKLLYAMSSCCKEVSSDSWLGKGPAQAQPHSWQHKPFTGSPC